MVRALRSACLGPRVVPARSGSDAALPCLQIRRRRKIIFETFLPIWHYTSVMDQHYDNSIEGDRRRFQMWVAGSIIGLLLLAVAGWFGRIPYRHFKEKREAAQAQAFLAKDDYRNALLSARQALRLDPTNVPACRVMTMVADLSHSPVTLDLLRRMVQAEPTVENKLLLASAGMRYQNPPYPLTAQILDELAVTAAGHATNLASYQVVAASLALKTRRLTDAETHFEAAAALEPTNRLFELNLAILRLDMTNEAKAAASRLVVKKYSTDAQLGSQALRSLVADRLAHKDLAAAKDYSTQLLAGPKATLADQLQQLGILQQLKSGDFAARLQAIQQSSATNALAAAQVAAWMQANSLLAGSVQWLTNLPASVRTQSPVRLALADSYLQSADWRTLRDFAGQGNWGDVEFLRLATVSRAWSQLDVKPVADSNWGAALTEAGSRYGALTALLRLAEQWNLTDKREDLLERIVEKFPQERWAQQALAQSYFTAGKTAELYKLYLRLFTLFPKDESFKNNLAATALLLKTNLEQAGQWAAEVHARTPDNPDRASTYAYALHLEGRDQDGLAVLQKLTPKQLELPSVTLYCGLLLAAAHDTNATMYLQIAGTQSHLLPEEKQLLAEALAK